MNSKQVVMKDSAELARQAAEVFVHMAQTSAKSAGRFTVAVSGGTTPREMHRLLARGPYRDEVPWKETHVFWVDERLVPYDHEASNFGAARVDWVEKVPLPPKQVYPMPVALPPEKCARMYQEKIAQIFPQRTKDYPAFDLIMLGIGADGHTASLFPGMSPQATEGRWVLHVKGGDPYVDRLTLSFQLINNARQVVFLIAGLQKAEVVHQVIDQNDIHLPAAYIRPQAGHLTWLLDADAASKITPPAGGKRKVHF